MGDIPLVFSLPDGVIGVHRGVYSQCTKCALSCQDPLVIIAVIILFFLDIFSRDHPQSALRERTERADAEIILGRINSLLRKKLTWMVS